MTQAIFLQRVTIVILDLLAWYTKHIINMKLRKKARQYGLKKRHLALTSKENVFANYLQKLAVNMIFEAHKHRENDEVARKFLTLARLVCGKYFSIVIKPHFIILINIFN